MYDRCVTYLFWPVLRLRNEFIRPFRTFDPFEVFFGIWVQRISNEYLVTPKPPSTR